MFELVKLIGFELVFSIQKISYAKKIEQINHGRDVMMFLREKLKQKKEVEK